MAPQGYETPSRRERLKPKASRLSFSSSLLDGQDAWQERLHPGMGRELKGVRDRLQARGRVEKIQRLFGVGPQPADPIASRSLPSDVTNMSRQPSLS